MVRARALCPPLSLSPLPSPAASHCASSQAESSTHATVWLRHVTGGQYVSVTVDLQRSTVHGLKASFAALECAGFPLSRLGLHLVSTVAQRPTAEEERAAASRDPLDPRDLLAEAGLYDGCSLLASMAGAAADALPDELQDEPVSSRSAVPYLLGQLGLFRRPRSVSASSSSSAQDRLKTELRFAYGFSPGASTMECSVLKCSLATVVISCAHLVPRQLREVWPLLGIADELRNVLLMFKCVEEAYDDFVLSLLWVGEQDGRDLYRIHVWDPELRLLPLTVNVRSRGSPRFPGIVLSELEGRTFGQLHGQLRQLHCRDHSPYRRSLAFQAQLACAKAVFSKWEVAEVDMAAVSPEVAPDKLSSLLAWRDEAAAQAALHQAE
jgi:hypothetical protein